MKFHLGSPPPTPDFTPLEEGWTPLREPTPKVFQFLGSVVGIVTAILIARAWGDLEIRMSFGPSMFGSYAPLVYFGVFFGIGFPLLIAVHELLHAAGYRRFGFTESTVIVVWPSHLLIFAGSFDAYRRNRWLLVYLLPFLMLTLLPLMVCRLLGIQSLAWSVISIVNALCAGGDIFCFFLILLQVPHDAKLRNQGWQTWWKRDGDTVIDSV